MHIRRCPSASKENRMTATHNQSQQMTDPLRHPSIVDRLKVHGEFLPEQKSIFNEAAARIQELETALRFYADSRRYQGANQKPIHDDPYPTPEGVTINDV